MANAVIVGGTGQIGFAVAQRLVEAGWNVTLTSRHPAPLLPVEFRHSVADGTDAVALSAIVGTDTDLLLSCVAYGADDSQRLAGISSAVGRIAVVSTASVYCDTAGRYLDTAASTGAPRFSGLLTEQTPTVDPDSNTYSSNKIAMERALLQQACCPVTILRPGAIHGPHSKLAREWWFVKRLLDGRQSIPLAYRGASQLQTTSTAAIANAVIQAANGQLPPIVNVADADCPTVTDIAQTIMRLMGMQAELIALPDEPNYPPQFGATPWSIPHPMVCSTIIDSAELYARAVEPAIRWLLDTVDNGNWRERLPVLASLPPDQFDYAADDRACALPGATRIA
ncbi:NAD-dependent epimerase/dehydratase family protein [Hyphomicrobium sp. D-2]|uniref:NAD-dependent epimerase/dehydratase family protein n=1 Tax=Hyphomicrobium sp. D-2 TaxID=3041621 RepID=UPI0024585235|nr:NAD-dependent epimerase/dehydratase family protein [Hyphomicrobium sp. D-2]MDH4983380.1 NAD-dependent epimerase/dehydratase family protein [Hyphomicrobium sp. D-2]